MEPDSLKQAWGSPFAQGRMTIDAELLLKEVQRSQRLFTAMLFWRDVREVGIALVLVPVWIYLGRNGIPWTWYLTVPALLWVAGFMVVHRVLHNRQSPEAGEPLRRRIENSLAQVEQQIWLLRNVFWWALLPMGVPTFIFFGHCFWLDGPPVWLGVLLFAAVVAVVIFVFAAVYWLNQYAVRTELEPRRQELAALLRSLTDEASA